MRCARSMALAMLLAAPCALAQTAWLQFPGTNIEGESHSLSHPRWVDVRSFGIDGAMKRDSPGAFKVVKHLDNSSPRLQLLCANGQRLESVVLDMTTLASKGETALMRLELEDVLVTSYDLSSSDGPPTEKVGLAFGKITFTYFPQGASEKSVYYNHITNQGGTGDGNNEPPFDPDTDDDGMPDDWERANGMTVGVNDASGDADGDGLSNISELQLGTDPKSATSFFKAELAMATEEGKMNLSWVSVAGKVYEVQWTPDLLTPFTTIQEVTGAGGSTTLPVTRTGTVGFYRVRPKP